MPGRGPAQRGELGGGQSVPQGCRGGVRPGNAPGCPGPGRSWLAVTGHQAQSLCPPGAGRPRAARKARKGLDRPSHVSHGVPGQDAHFKWFCKPGCSLNGNWPPPLGPADSSQSKARGRQVGVPTLTSPSGRVWPRGGQTRVSGVVTLGLCGQQALGSTYGLAHAPGSGLRADALALQLVGVI